MCAVMSRTASTYRCRCCSGSSSAVRQCMIVLHHLRRMHFSLTYISFCMHLTTLGMRLKHLGASVSASATDLLITCTSLLTLGGCGGTVLRGCSVLPLRKMEQITELEFCILQCVIIVRRFSVGQGLCFWCSHRLTSSSFLVWSAHYATVTCFCWLLS